MSYSFIYTRPHSMVLIWFQSLFKFSVWDPTHSSVLIIVGTVMTHKISDTGTKHLPATDERRNEEIQSSNHLHVHSCKVTFSHYANLPKCIIDTADIRNTWCFLYLFLWSMICRNQIEETLYPYLWVCG